MTKPHLVSVPDTPNKPVLLPFERDNFSEGMIATDIGAIVTEIKEAYQRDMGTKNADEYDQKRRAKRTEMAAKIFKKFGMLSREAQADFAVLYSEAERVVEHPATSHRELVGDVLSHEEHPVIRTTMSLAQVAGEGAAREDAVAVQRAAAILLADVEQPGVWKSQL